MKFSFFSFFPFLFSFVFLSVLSICFFILCFFFSFFIFFLENHKIELLSFLVGKKATIFFCEN